MAIPALRSTDLQRLLHRVQRPWLRYVEQRAIGRYSAQASRLLDQLARNGQGEFESGTPHVADALITRSDVVILMLSDSSSASPTKVLKLPLTPDAEHSTSLHRQVVTTLHSMPMLRSFYTLVPRALAWGTFEDKSYYLETALAGEVASDLVRRRAEPTTFKHEAVRAIRQLHLGTAQRRVVDAAAFTQLVGDDLAVLYQQSEHWPAPALMRDALQSIEATLRRRLIGLDLPFGWIHGDYWPGNILVQPGGLGGIIDWDRAMPNQLPLLDILHLLAYVRKMQQRTELGEEIVSYLLPAAFDQSERALIDETLTYYGLPDDSEFWHAASYLYWLRFAAANLMRYPRLQNDSFWLNKNVLNLLKRGLT